MATTSIIQIEDGCYVVYRQPKIKGNVRIEQGYVSTITQDKESGEYSTVLVNENETVLASNISLKNLWHIGKDHSK